jgi:lipopolysaccharide transport system permease protein
MFGFSNQDTRLLVNLFKMNIRDRYMGSALGRFWAITNPLFMLCLYTYIFGFVFKVRLPGAETTLAYVIWLISGYGPWLATTEALMGAANSVVGASGMVKNMAFKTELLPIAGALSGITNLAVSLVFLILLMAWSGSPPTWHILLLPVVVLVQFGWLIALGIWLGAISVFVRDLLQFLPNLLMALMFLTPIFYPYESMPGPIKIVSLGNPFHHIAEAYRAILIGGQAPDLLGLAFVALLSYFFFHFGLMGFRRAKGVFDSAI